MATHNILKEYKVSEVKVLRKLKEKLTENFVGF